VDFALKGKEYPLGRELRNRVKRSTKHLNSRREKMNRPRKKGPSEEGGGGKMYANLQVPDKTFPPIPRASNHSRRTHTYPAGGFLNFGAEVGDPRVI